jgi:hypothetical protein
MKTMLHGIVLYLSSNISRGNPEVWEANYVGANHVLAVDKTWEEALATLSRVTQSRR